MISTGRTTGTVSLLVVDLGTSSVWPLAHQAAAKEWMSYTQTRHFGFHGTVCFHNYKRNQC